MVPPPSEEVYKKKILRVRKKPVLSAIKEEDELKKNSEVLSALYPGSSKQKKIISHIPKIKKTSKLVTSKQTSARSKDTETKIESTPKQKKDSIEKRKQKVSKNKTKVEIPAAQQFSPERILSNRNKLNQALRPFIRSFADPDLTSLPIDEVIGKHSYLTQNQSKLSSPVVKKVRTKRSKKSTSNTVTKEKENKLSKKKEPNNSISKKEKVKKGSKIPKKISKSKRNVEGKKIVAKIPLD